MTTTWGTRPKSYLGDVFYKEEEASEGVILNDWNLDCFTSQLPRLKVHFRGRSGWLVVGFDSVTFSFKSIQVFISQNEGMKASTKI